VKRHSNIHRFLNRIYPLPPMHNLRISIVLQINDQSLWTCPNPCHFGYHFLNRIFPLPPMHNLRISISLQMNDQSLLRTRPNPCHFGPHCWQNMKMKTKQHPAPGADIPARLYGPTHLQNIVVGKHHPSLKQSEWVLIHPVVHHTFEWINTHISMVETSKKGFWIGLCEFSNCWLPRQPR